MYIYIYVYVYIYIYINKKEGKKIFIFLSIEDAMWRRHRRPRILGSAVCDSFCKLWRMRGRGCVGTVVDLYGSWPILGGS